MLVLRFSSLVLIFVLLTITGQSPIYLYIHTLYCIFVILCVCVCVCVCVCACVCVCDMSEWRCGRWADVGGVRWNIFHARHQRTIRRSRSFCLQQLTTCLRVSHRFMSHTGTYIHGRPKRDNRTIDRQAGRSSHFYRPLDIARSTSGTRFRKIL